MFLAVPLALFLRQAALQTTLRGCSAWLIFLALSVQSLLSMKDSLAMMLLLTHCTKLLEKSPIHSVTSKLQCVDIDNNMARTNTNNDCPRKLIVVTCRDQNNEAAAKQDHLGVLHALRDFMVRSEHNKFLDMSTLWMTSLLTSPLPMNIVRVLTTVHLTMPLFTSFLPFVRMSLLPGTLTMKNWLSSAACFAPPNFPHVAIAGLGHQPPGAIEAQDDSNEN